MNIPFRSGEWMNQTRPLPLAIGRGAGRLEHQSKIDQHSGPTLNPLSINSRPAWRPPLPQQP